MSDEGKSRGRGLLTASFAGILVLIIGALVLASYPRVSPIDELQHLDSSLKAAEGRWYLPRGELVGQDAMRIEACSGIDAGFVPPPCSSPEFDPAQFQESGVNTAAGRMSPYYVVTGYLGRLISAITGAGFLVSARIVGLMSLALASGLLAWGVLRLSESRLLAVSLGSAPGLLPPVLSMAIVVNPEAWSLLAGTVVPLLALGATRWSPLRAFILLSLGVGVAVSAKPNFVFLLFVPILVLGHVWWYERTAVNARRFVAGVGAGAIGFLSFAAPYISTLLIDNDAPPDPMTSRFTVAEGTPWPFGTAFDSILSSFVPMYQGSTIDVFEQTALIGVAAAFTVILVAGSVAAVVMSPTQSRSFLLGVAGVMGLVVTPTAVFAGLYVSNLFIGYPHRYSFVVLPVLALAWGALRPHRRWIFAGLSLALVAASLYALYIG